MLRSWSCCRSKLISVVRLPSTHGRSYHQYKPKDRPHDVTKHDSSYAKDYLLFRYEDPARIFWRNLGAVTMLPLWAYLSHFAYHLKERVRPCADRVEDESKNWVYRNVARSGTGVAVGFFLFGAGLSAYWTSRTLRTVRRLVLRKGGKHVTIITYGLLGATSKHLTVPLSHCSGVRRNFQGNQRFFLNVKGHPFKYQFNVDDGIFSNKPMFDRTVGLARRLY